MRDKASKEESGAPVCLQNDYICLKEFFMRRPIKKVAVLGSGVMGSRIACHFANAGIPVILLDIVPKDLTPEEQKKGYTGEHPVVRNRIVNQALQAVVKSAPSPVFTKEVLQLIQTGNLEDDLNRISECDWVIEAVTEQLDIKKQLYEKVEEYRTNGTLITTNTSGIPVNMLVEGRSDDFKKHFCGAHFFNPPRYLRLLEIIPAKDTDSEVVDFLMHFGDLYLGKTTVLCKDTPAFIANRIGVYSIMVVLHLMEKLDLNIDEADALTGTLIGHPKSATFRTCDVVGIDTFVKVADDLLKNCPEDEAQEWFKVPAYVRKLVADNRLGAKTGSGFYKKVKTEKGSEILTLDISSDTYKPRSKPRFPELTSVKAEEDVKVRLQSLFEVKGKAGDFFRQFHYHLFAYVSHRIPEITEELYQIDEAMKAGFGWQLGPFEIWDLSGVRTTVKRMQEEEIEPSEWVAILCNRAAPSFYKVEKGTRLFYDQKEQTYKKIPGSDAFMILDDLSERIVWKNSVCKLKDLDDGIICLEWETKMNTIGSDVISGINKAIEIGEKDFLGLLLGNQGANFSAGANVGLIFMMAVEQDWDELNQAIKSFQQTSMHIRYCPIPVVAVPHGLTLGGGCEFCLHADAVLAAAETYMGLVETGLGIIPAGGGTKEFVLRASDSYQKGEIELPVLQQRFMTIGLAKASTSAAEAYQLGLMRKGKDRYAMNARRVLADAKRDLLGIIASGYVPPAKRKDIKVLGRNALGALLVGIDSMRTGNFISEHDAKVAQKLAYVMCGGDLSAMTPVDEQYLLDLEREAFISLCGERKTLERLQALVKTGKIIRN